jgi:hypothetical protein
MSRYFLNGGDVRRVDGFHPDDVISGIDMMDFTGDAR